jgi:DNA repair exonuclease SbcCD ATPase subunit
MNNELIYDVILKLDPNSVKSMQDELNKVAKGMDATVAQAQAEATKQTAEALKEFNVQTKEAVKVSGSGSKALAELSKRMEDTKAQIDSYNKQVKMGFPLSDEDRTKKEELKLQLKDLSAEYNKQQRDVLSLANTITGTANTYKDLQAQNKALAVEMKSIPLDDTSGRLQKLQGQYKANTEKLKEFDEEMGMHQRNVGDYKTAIMDAIKAKTGFDVAGVKNVFTLKALKTAFISTGVGALVVGITALVAALMKMQPVVDFLERRMAELGAAFEYVRDVVGSWIGLNERNNRSMSDTIRLARELKQAQQDLAETEITAITVKAKLQTEISKLRTAIMDENVATEDKLALINEAFEKERQLTEVETYLAKERFRIAQQQLNLNESDREARREVAEAEANLIRVEFDSANRRREMAEKRIGLVNMISATEKRAKDEEIARIAELNEARRLGDVGPDAIVDDTLNAELEAEAKRAEMLLQANFAYFEARKLQEIEAIRASGNEFGAIEMERQMALQQIRVDAINAGIESEDEIRQLQAAKNLEFDKKVEDTRTAITKAAIANRSKLMGMAVDGAMALGKALFGESKGMAIAQALIDTYQSANVALKSAPPPWNFALAAANVAAGIANVNRIRQMKPGSSGGGGGASAPATPSVPSGMASPTFGTVNTNQISASMGGGNMPAPVLILQGDLDSELLAIKVRQGSDQLSSRGVSVVSA